MDEKLKPCPFCGKSVAEIDDAKELGGCPYYDDCDQAEYEQCEMHTVVCNVHKGGCGASSGYYDTVEDAVAAWNRHAGRTCNPTHTREKWECDVCGCVIRPGFMPESHGVGVLRYCPVCGSRVVSE